LLRRLHQSCVTLWRADCTTSREGREVRKETHVRPPTHLTPRGHQDRTTPRRSGRRTTVESSSMIQVVGFVSGHGAL
jgi:hypothetical protein